MTSPRQGRVDGESSGLATLGCIAALAFLLVAVGGGVAFYVASRAGSVPEAVGPIAPPLPPLAPPPVPPLAPPVAPPVSSTPAPVPTALGGDGAETAETAEVPSPGAPEITEGTEVRGALSREVIRATIRRNINEVRRCYERGLTIDPTLDGRVTVAFIISATGAVQTANVASTTLSSPTGADESVVACIVERVRTWTFPPPDGGGIVGVNYPFVLSSAP